MKSEAKPKKPVNGRKASVKTSNSAPSFVPNGNGNGHLTDEQLREAAYFRYLNDGCPSGHDLDYWLAAEAELTRHEFAECV